MATESKDEAVQRYMSYHTGRAPIHMDFVAPVNDDHAAVLDEFFVQLAKLLNRMWRRVWKVAETGAYIPRKGTPIGAVQLEMAEVFHVAEYIEDEMEARQWSREQLVQHMFPLESVTVEEFGLASIKLELLLSTRDQDTPLGEMAQWLGRAFGTSAEVWSNLHEAWRTHPNTVAEHAAGELTDA